MKIARAFLCFLVVWPAVSFGWGEAGHHIIARVAAKLTGQHPVLKEIKDPEGRKALETYLRLLKDRRYQEGHVANVPDTLWRHLDGGQASAAASLGNPTHVLQGEYFAADGVADPYANMKAPLDYEAAKAHVARLHPNVPFFKAVGSAPWRAQQFANLFRAALENYPKQSCDALDSREDHPTRAALAYAGLLSHFTADAAMPFHATRDHDGVETGQKGIHWYFENELVDPLDAGLEVKVEAAALKLLTAPARDKTSIAAFEKLINERYPGLKKEDRVTALLFAELGDSFGKLKRLRDLDKKFAVATAEEALSLEACRPTVSAVMTELEKTPAKWKRKELLGKKALGAKDSEQAACRRSPTTPVDGMGNACKVLSEGCRTVAGWHESLIVERLSLGAAITADVWARTWKEAGAPAMCWSWPYALKPSFVSPTDNSCFGYARNEKPEEILASTKPPIQLWRTTAKSPFDCIKF